MSTSSAVKSRLLTISQAARLSGVAAKTIRYYEGVGLIPAATRSDSGYRLYDDRAIHTLGFVKRARDLGFSIEQITDLLALWQDGDRASADVRALAKAHIAAIEQKIAELDSMRKTLAHLVHRCHGDDRPDCPILDDLATLDVGEANKE